MDQRSIINSSTMRNITMSLLINDLDNDLTLDRQALSKLSGGQARRRRRGAGGNQFALVIVNINRDEPYTPVVPLLRVNF